MNIFKIITTSALVAILALSGQSLGAQDGAPASEAVSGPQNAVDAGRIPPFRAYRLAGLYSAGVGLRNRAMGGIELSGIPAGMAVRDGWLYWNIITDAAPTRAQRRIFLQRVSPGRSGRTRLLGRIVGQGESPCWGGLFNTVLRARVTPAMVPGNGTYLVSVPAAQFGLTDGSLPWGNVQHPSINGASLFVVTEGNSEVMIYDQPLSGQMFFTSLDYRLRIPNWSDNRFTTILHMANSDGQTGSGVLPNTASTNENTSVNGNVISGPLAPVLLDSDWNGDEGGSYTQLWDNPVHDVSQYASSSATPLAVNVTAGFDCLVPVAVGVMRN